MDSDSQMQTENEQCHLVVASIKTTFHLLTVSNDQINVQIRE